MKRFGILAAAILIVAAGAKAQAPAPIRIAVDATQVARGVLHARLTIPVRPGPLTLYYPKWLPADHSPDGPIANLADLRFSANGRAIAWRQDVVDMYAFRLDVPAGARTLIVHLDFLLDAPGPTIDFAASASARLLILMWNEVSLYPSGWPVHELTYLPSLRLPAGWEFHTALPVAGHEADIVRFRPVPYDLLVDSPVQAGAFTRVIPLSPPRQSPSEELDVAADDPSALNIPPSVIADYRRLVTQALLLYGSYHYRDYHFLLTLSDYVLPLGQEHHESSDDRVGERTLLDPNLRLLAADLLPHEFTHSWNGQYRRPLGLSPPDFQAPMKGKLLWVYEGLTSYLATVLATRSGLWTPLDAREQLARIASALRYRAGRSWRSLQNTANAAQILYFAPSEWQSARRGTDFYTQSVLLWLGVDAKIRDLSHGQRSLDDFCRRFFAGDNGQPIIRTYTFSDLTRALDAVAPFDWDAYLRARLDSTDALGEPGWDGASLAASGWRLAYDEHPNVLMAASQAAFGAADLTSSLGLVVRADGSIVDVVPGQPAAAAGLAPYMRIVAVDGRQLSLTRLQSALQATGVGPAPLAIEAWHAGRLATYSIRYRGGLRNPHLQRLSGQPDRLSDILRPLAAPAR